MQLLAGRTPVPSADAPKRRGMRKVNTNDVDELTWSSPKGTFSGAGRQISEALGTDYYDGEE